MSSIKISPGNTKLGAIPSVSLPSVLTCRTCQCQKKCYARRLERLRPSVRQAYRTNLDVLQNDPHTYWREVEAAIMLSRFFRFHVSGDIPDEAYFRHMVEAARKNPHCQILCFTKKFEIVNEYISEEYLAGIRGTTIRPALCNMYENVVRAVIPDNLHITFSAWVGLDLVNPFSLPVAHVRYRDGTTTASEKAVECGGNCSDCAVTEGGCWSLKAGEEVVFREH